MVRKLGVNRLVGIDSNWVFDLFLGMILAIAIFVLGRIFGIIAVIGLPSIPQSVAVTLAGVFIIKVVAASVFETVLFQDIILDFFDSKLKLPFLVAAIISSLLFMLFHLTAYESVGAGASSYFLVFLWGMIFCYLRRYTNSIISVIGAHGMLNFIIEFIINRRLIVFG